MFEKSVTLIGTIISVITFVLSILNWFGFSIALDSSIPNKRVASTILIGYAGLASAASSWTLIDLSRKGKQIAPLWFALTLSYAFGFLFLLDKTVHFFTADPNFATKAIEMATWCYSIAFFVLFVWPKWFPDGYSFWRHIMPGLGLFWTLVAMSNGGALYLMFIFLHGMNTG